MRWWMAGVVSGAVASCATVATMDGDGRVLAEAESEACACPEAPPLGRVEVPCVELETLNEDASTWALLEVDASADELAGVTATVWAIDRPGALSEYASADSPVGMLGIHRPVVIGDGWVAVSCLRFDGTNASSATFTLPR